MKDIRKKSQPAPTSIIPNNNPNLYVAIAYWRTDGSIDIELTPIIAWEITKHKTDIRSLPILPNSSLSENTVYAVFDQLTKSWSLSIDEICGLDKDSMRAKLECILKLDDESITENIDEFIVNLTPANKGVLRQENVIGFTREALYKAGGYCYEFSCIAGAIERAGRRIESLDAKHPYWITDNTDTTDE